MTKSKRRRDKGKAELLQGTLDMLIMQTLRRGARHGHGIGQAIQVTSGDLLHIEAGSLYPALHRLERQAMIVSDWKVSEHNQRARYYRLTPAGRRQLAVQESKWDLVTEAMSRVRRPSEG